MLVRFTTDGQVGCLCFLAVLNPVLRTLTCQCSFCFGSEATSGTRRPLGFAYHVCQGKCTVTGGFPGNLPITGPTYSQRVWVSLLCVQSQLRKDPDHYCSLALSFCSVSSFLSCGACGVDLHVRSSVVSGGGSALLTGCLWAVFLSAGCGCGCSFAWPVGVWNLGFSYLC